MIYVKKIPQIGVHSSSFIPQLQMHQQTNVLSSHGSNLRGWKSTLPRHYRNLGANQQTGNMKLIFFLLTANNINTSMDLPV